MDLATYRKNVFKTLSIKNAKEGMRKVARRTPTTNIAHAIVGLSTEVGELLEGLQPYLLGFQFTDELKRNAREELGDISYYTVVLCKMLKIKMPTSTKKVALKGMTPTKALLTLHKISNDLLDQYKKSFYGRDMDVQLIAEIAQPLPNLLYAIHFWMFHEPIASTMAGNIAKLAARYPEGTFDSDAQHARNKDVELNAMDDAAAQHAAAA
jgi:NTP pyrophosphatase (non-canonical NTP hydrolase)